jgi:hypothetical protein
MEDILDRPSPLTPPARYGRKSEKILWIQGILIFGFIMIMSIKAILHLGGDPVLRFFVGFVFLVMLVLPLLGLVYVWRSYRAKERSKHKTLLVGSIHLVIFFGLSTLLSILIIQR